MSRRVSMRVSMRRASTAFLSVFASRSSGDDRRDFRLPDDTPVDRPHDDTPVDRPHDDTLAFVFCVRPLPKGARTTSSPEA